MIGVIDVGSNSVKLQLLRREGDQFHPLERHVRTTRLIQGMEDGVPTPQACDRTLAAMEEFCRMAREAGCETVRAFGTSAMRDAKNRGELIARAAAFGLPLEVLSGEEEASLAYLGESAAGTMGMMDTGGGSTQLVAGADGQVLASVCVPLGAVRLQNALPEASPEELIARAEEILRPAWAAVEAVAPRRWIGVSGAMRCLKALEIGALDMARIAGQPLTRGTVEKQLFLLAGMPVEQRRALPGMCQDRADMLPYSAAILTAFFRLSGAEGMQVAQGGGNTLGYARLRNLF